MFVAAFFFAYYPKSRTYYTKSRARTLYGKYIKINTQKQPFVSIEKKNIIICGRNWHPLDRCRRIIISCYVKCVASTYYWACGGGEGSDEPFGTCTQFWCPPRTRTDKKDMIQRRRQCDATRVVMYHREFYLYERAGEQAAEQQRRPKQYRSDEANIVKFCHLFNRAMDVFCIFFLFFLRCGCCVVVIIADIAA